MFNHNYDKQRKYFYIFIEFKKEVRNHCQMVSYMIGINDLLLTIFYYKRVNDAFLLLYTNVIVILINICCSLGKNIFR